MLCSTVIRVSGSVGIIGFFVYAKNEDARCYYEQYGFVVLPNNPLKSFVPLATLKQALA